MGISAAPADAGEHRVEVAGIGRRQHQAGALGGEALRHRAPQPARRAGDQRPDAVEPDRDLRRHGRGGASSWRDGFGISGVVSALKITLSSAASPVAATDAM